MHGVDRAVRGAGRLGRPGDGGRDAEADLLALHVSGGRLDPGRDQSGRRLAFDDVEGRGRAAQQDDGGDGQGANVLLGQDAATEGEEGRPAQDVDADRRDQGGQRRRVFQRMGRVDVEHPAAVDAQLLDGQLAGGREQADRLRSAFQRRRLGRGRQRLHHAQPGQNHGHDEGDGQQDIEAGARQVGPEVADALAAIGDEGAGQRGGDGRAGGRRDEVLHRQADHLGEGRNRRLAAIALPVGVGDEADGGVEGQVRADAVKPLRVHRQNALEPQHGVQQDEARQIEGQQGAGVTQPALAAARIDPGGAIEEALDRLQHRVQPGAFAVPDARHIDPDRPAEQNGQTEGQGDFRPSLNIHLEAAPLRTAQGAAGPRPCSRR
ncbi:hypothetical protein D3C85_1062280 [compost metagenome]